jgi:hypothetical protein
MCSFQISDTGLPSVFLSVALKTGEVSIYEKSENN